MHVIPRGRISAYVGSGAHYQDFRIRYRTAQEPISVAFHGMSVPAVVGLGVYPHKNIALGVEARYIHSMYWIAALSSSAMSGPVPLSILDNAAMDAGASPVRQRLPSFWTVNASARLRF